MRSVVWIVAAQDAGARRAGGGKEAREAHCHFRGFGKLMFTFLEIGWGSAAFSSGAIWREFLTRPLATNRCGMRRQRPRNCWHPSDRCHSVAISFVKPKRNPAGGQCWHMMPPEQNVTLTLRRLQRGTAVRLGYQVLKVCSTLTTALHYVHCGTDRWRCLSR